VFEEHPEEVSGLAEGNINKFNEFLAVSAERP